MHLEITCGKWRSSGLDIDVLNRCCHSVAHSFGVIVINWPKSISNKRNSLRSQRWQQLSTLFGTMKTPIPHNRPLESYVKLRVAHASGMPGTFSPPPTLVPWCMSGLLNPRWRGKRSRHSWSMRNPEFLRIWQETHNDPGNIINDSTWAICNVKYTR